MYFQVGLFRGIGAREKEAVERLCDRLRERGLHPDRVDFRGDSVFVYLSDEETTREQVYRMMDTAAQEIKAVFGDNKKKGWFGWFGKTNDFFGTRISYRFRHKYWSY